MSWWLDPASGAVRAASPGGAPAGWAQIDEAEFVRRAAAARVDAASAEAASHAAVAAERADTLRRIQEGGRTR